jgi:hypothetical protein
VPKIVTGFQPDTDFDLAAKAGLGVDEEVADAEGAAETENEEELEATTPERLLQIAQAADRQALTFAQQHWRRNWEQNYKSFRSEYQDNSKYKSADFRHRSQIFRPKTRISVTKDLAGAAQTLFGTINAVSIQPGDETDPLQVANAELNAALVNYRLDRTSQQNAISWFLVAMGARQDCQIAGVCVSKSYWEFEEHPTKIDEQTGRKKRVKDKPCVDLFPPENVGLDPAASWIDPVQTGAYFYVRIPMHIQEVRSRMKDKRIPWKRITDEKIWATAKVREFETAQVRRAREGGADRLDNQTATDKELDVVWIYEWFIRAPDGDWNFWTLGTSHLLSDPKLTEEAYPWRGGERPYRIGYGNLEAHRIVPQSPVETLRPLQQEINDITNLRLDNLKQVIQPVALVKRGMKIDTDALKRRYPVLFVGNPKEDVQWDRPPDSAASSFAETSRLDTDFDDLAGTFNGGSVANNRQVGETVGGMKMMAGAANAVSEFYVRLWVETWVEPVLADVSKLEAYYEDDAKILALAKKRANKRLKPGISDITDELLNQEVVVRVSAGVGSPDPMQKLAKIGQAIELTSKVVAGSRKFASGELQPNEEAIIDEIWGNAGYRDGFERFFEKGEPPPPQSGEKPPSQSINFKDLPAEGKVQLAAKAGIQIQAPQQEDPAANAAADHDSAMSIAKLKARTDITKELIKQRSDHSYQGREHKKEGRHAFMETIMEAMHGHQESKHRDEDRKVAAQKPKAAAGA